MAGGNLSPRQKMINLMYLVLTALLALNVSKEILDSFVTVNNGLENTKLSLNDKMSAQYRSFEDYAKENQAKYGGAWNEAKKIKAAGADLISYIDSIKVKVIISAEGLPYASVVLGDGRLMDLMKVSKKDSHDELTNILVGSEPAKPIEGPLVLLGSAGTAHHVPPDGRRRDHPRYGHLLVDARSVHRQEPVKQARGSQVRDLAHDDSPHVLGGARHHRFVLPRSWIQLHAAMA